MKTLKPRRGPDRRQLVAGTAAALALAGCSSMDGSTRPRQQVASLIGFLFPGKEQPGAASEQVAVIKVPFRIGVAFVPDSSEPAFRLSELDRQRLAGQVREAFSNYPFVKEIEVVPSSYLERGGSFENLDRVAALLRLDVIALVSYDQVQYAGSSKWSFLYWTGIGAYVIEGEKYDILTALEVAVIDVKSRRLLMRASGSSTVKGDATWIGFAERSRQARTESFEGANRQMIGELHTEVQRFRERAPRDPGIRLELPPGYDPRAPR